MKKSINEKELNRMGIGWFIIKLAEENSIKINTSSTYGKQSSMETREKVYERTRNDHRKYIKYILNNWSSRITAGDPQLSNDAVRDLLDKVAKTLGII